MSDDRGVWPNVEYKQTPENVWEATSICLFAIVAPLRQRGLITAAEMRAITDRVLAQYQAMIGEEWGPGIYGTGNPPLDYANYGTIQEMVTMFCKEQFAQEAMEEHALEQPRPALSVVEGGRADDDDDVCF